MKLNNVFPTVGVALCISATMAASASTAVAAQERKAGARITDAWITMKVHSQFVPEDALEDSNIDVDTTNGVVMLSGTVATEAGRSRAIAIAKATDGVKSVNDKLKVAPATEKPTGATARDAGREATGTAKAGGRRVTDGWIKSKIYAQFLTENALEDSDIDVDVRTGVVTLAGMVPTEAGRTRALAIAKATDGVKNVKDSLKVGKR
jgi:hyperosmotically inducible periplasmic protein